MKRKMLLLQDNMADENEMVVFEADIPYEVVNNEIENENGLIVKVNEIWVDYHLVHQQIK